MPRSSVGSFYRDADVFILPTLSDGFAITLLEARSWKLPVITSDRCGQVIQDGDNGMVLKSIEPEVIATALRRLLASPALLAKLTHGSTDKCLPTTSLAEELCSIAASALRSRECVPYSQ